MNFWVFFSFRFWGGVFPFVLAFPIVCQAEYPSPSGNHGFHRYGYDPEAQCSAHLGYGEHFRQEETEEWERKRLTSHLRGTRVEIHYLEGSELLTAIGRIVSFDRKYESWPLGWVRYVELEMPWGANQSFPVSDQQLRSWVGSRAN